MFRAMPALASEFSRIRRPNKKAAESQKAPIFRRILFSEARARIRGLGVLNLVGLSETYTKEDRNMKRALVIIAVALGMFGVAAVAMVRHHHHHAPNTPNGAYANLQRR
jgi:hypothetical protein